MVISFSDQRLCCTLEEKGRIHPVDRHGHTHVGLPGDLSGPFAVWLLLDLAVMRGSCRPYPPQGGGVASCIQIVIRSKTFFLKHPKSRTSPVPNFFHTVVEDFSYWGRSNVLLMFCLKSFSKVKFYNSSPMYIRYTVIIMTSAHHPANKHTSPHTPQPAKKFLTAMTIRLAPQQQTNPFITPNKSIF